MRAPLAILPGIVSDDTSFASEGRWVDGSNMRPWRGSMQTVGGWNLEESGLTGVCRNLLPWTDNSGFTNIALGTHSKLYTLTAGALYDITPSSGFTAGAEHGAGGPGWGAGGYGSGPWGGPSSDDYFPLTWSLSNWGENLIANPRNQSLFLWENNTASAATEITQAPDNITCSLVTPQRQVLAFGCNEESGGTFNPLAIRGCDIEDYTDWTTTRANSVFEDILEGSGRIVGARLIGDYIGVWTDTGFYIGQYIGAGDQVYRWDKVERNCGLVGPNAVQIVNQQAYWITPDLQFYTWAPGTMPQVMPCPIRNDFKDNLDRAQADKICATSITQYGEVWWFYPDTRDGTPTENSRYVAFSTTEGAWFRGDIARTAAVDSGPARFPTFVTSDGYIYSHETGQTANGGALSWSLTTADQYIDEASRYVMLRGIWPDFEDQSGAASLTLTLKNYPQDSTTYTKGPYTIGAGVSKKDFLAQCRVIQAAFSGSSSPAFVRFGKPSLDVVVTGRE